MQTYKSMLKVSAVLLKLQLSVEVEAKEPQDGCADADSFRRRWCTDHLRNLLISVHLSATAASVYLWSWGTGAPQDQVTYSELGSTLPWGGHCWSHAPALVWLEREEFWDISHPENSCLLHQESKLTKQKWEFSWFLFCGASCRYSGMFNEGESSTDHLAVAFVV